MEEFRNSKRKTLQILLKFSDFCFVFLQQCYLFIQCLAVLHQHFHSFRKSGIAVCTELGIVLYFLNGHPCIFQAFNKFNPCKVFVGIAAAVACISFRHDQAFMLIIAQGYKGSVTKKAVSAAAYEQNIMEAAGILE